MQIGAATIFQNPGRRVSDREVYLQELRLADLVEPLGFDSLWSVEHHFSDYTMVPDVTQFLAYMAGRTQRVSLGTMVIVLPWHDPVRVVEEICLLDILADGRVLLGIGRGAGRIEFEGLRVPLGESRERFVEASEIVLRALEEGRIAADGKFHQIPQRDIRPAPFKSFRGRTYGAMVSPETAEILAELGVGLLIIPQKSWEDIAQDLTHYTEACRKHGTAPMPPIAAAWVFCSANAREAEEGARCWIGNYWKSAMMHYEIGGEHFKTTKGYEYYGKLTDMMESAGPGVQDLITEAFVSTQVWGTPKQCVEKITDIQERVGNDHFVGVFSYGGMPIDVAERSMRLFAAEVLPKLRQDRDQKRRVRAAVAIKAGNG